MIEFDKNKFGTVSAVDSNGNEFILCDDNTIYINDKNVDCDVLRSILAKMKALQDTACNMQGENNGA